MDKKEEVTLKVWNDKISINLIGMKKLAFVDNTPGMYDLVRNARFRILKLRKLKKITNILIQMDIRNHYIKLYLIIISGKNCGKKHIIRAI